MRIVVMSLVASTVFGLIHWYLWARLIKATTTKTRIRRIAATTAGILAILPLLALVLREQSGLPKGLRDALSWAGFLWLGIMFYLLIALIVAEPIRLALRGWVRCDKTVTDKPVPAELAPATGPTESAPSPVAVETITEKPSVAKEPTGAPHGTSRRLILSRGLAAGAGLVAVSTVGYGINKAFSKPVIEHVPITLSKLDSALDGYRIGVVSDIHLGPFVRKPRVQTIVNTLNRLDVSAVSIVGDLVDGDVEDLGGYAEPLGELNAHDGTFFVTGNHEYYSGVEQWVEFLPTLGVRVLQNERLTITHGGASFDLAGINDLAESDVDAPDAGMKKALDGRDKTNPVVLLAHQPVLFDDAVKHGVDLQLSGHTHGGQMWPFHYLVRLQQPKVAGHSRKKASQLYVTRGVGFWGPPIRVGAPPEITIIELRSAT